MHNVLAHQQNTHELQKFSEHDARKLVEDMLFMYGKKFTDQWSGLKKGQVIEKFVEKLSELTYEQFLRGLKRLDTADWPPTIPEFKNWCKGVYEYQTHDEAWLQALTYEKHNRSHVINKFAKQAFDEVMKPYGYLGSTDTFYRVYCSVYKRIITEAKERNEADEIFAAVSQLENKQEDADHKPVEKEDARLALENLKKKLNVRNRHVEKAQEFKPTEKPQQVKQELGPDPFDNPEAYAEMCRRDGMPVPRDIAALVGGGA